MDRDRLLHDEVYVWMDAWKIAYTNHDDSACSSVTYANAVAASALAAFRQEFNINKENTNNG